MAPELAFRLVVKDDGTAVVERFSSGVKKSANKAVGATTRMSAAFSKLKKRVSGLPGAVFNLRNAIGVLVVGAGLRKLIDVFGSFEKQMNKVAAITGAVAGPAFEALEGQARRLGETTQFSARQAADSMAFLAQAGFKTNEIVSALPRTLELAAAASIDLGRAADITTNIVTGAGIPFKDLGRANDVLVKAFTSTNINLSQLGTSFKFVGPIAVGAGIQFEEITAAIGLLGNAGLQGSLAGTTLRRAITRLLRPSTEGAAVMERLGVNALDASGKLKPLREIIRQLGEGSATTTDLIQIFGDRAGPGLAVLVKQGADKLADLTKELENSGGIAQRIAKVQLRGLFGALVKLKSATEGAIISIGDGLAPTISKVANTFTIFTKNLSDALKAMDFSSQGAMDTSDSFDTLTPSAKTLIQVITLLSQSFNVAGIILGLLGAAALVAAIPFAGLIDIFKKGTPTIDSVTDKLELMLGFIERQKKAFDDSRDSIGRATDALRRLREQEIAAKESIEQEVVAERKRKKLLEERIQARKKAAAAIKAIMLEDLENSEFTLKRADKLRLRDLRKEQMAADERRTLAETATPTKTLFNLVFAAEGELNRLLVTASQRSLDRIKKNVRDAGEAFFQLQTKDPQAAARILEQVAAAEGEKARTQAFVEGVNKRVSFAEEEARILFELSLKRRLSLQDDALFNQLNQEERLAILKQGLAAETQARADAAQRKSQIESLEKKTTDNFLRAGLSFAKTAGGKSFAESKAFAVGEAVITGIVAVQRTLSNPPGPPATFPLAASVAAITLANVASIIAAKPGSSGGATVSGGGGGGGGIGASAISSIGAPPALTEQAKQPLEVNISVAGFIGNEAELASALGPVIEEAVGDSVDFGLQTSR